MAGYMKCNFFYGNARFLAHDVEEDDEDMKCELYIWAFGFQWQWHYQELLTSREALWKVIGHRGIVSRACCEKVHPKKLTYTSE
jgi:speedy protein